MAKSDITVDELVSNPMKTRKLKTSSSKNPGKRKTPTQKSAGIQRPVKTRRKNAKSLDALVGSVGKIAEHLNALSQQAFTEYAPLVENLIQSRCTDTNRIEHTLDDLLNFGGHPPMVVLFRRLCRHLWYLDQDSAAQYVHIFCETWDPEKKIRWRTMPLDMPPRSGR